MKSYTVAATILLLTSSTMHTDAFSSWISRYPQHQQRLGGGFAIVGGTHFRQLVSDRYRPLFASEEKEEEEEENVDVDVEATVPESEVEEESSEEVSEEKEEDPELKALKEEISKLETELKSKRFVLNDGK